MRLGIMQPYFLPYIGYFQLMKSVDTFIIYDNIKYTKRGWINKNRILVNGSDKLFSIPVKKDSDYLKIGERELANNSLSERKKILRQITNSYAKAPYFASTYPIIEKCFLCEESNLFHYILYSIK